MRWHAEVQVGLKQNMGFESVEACHKLVPCIFQIKIAGQLQLTLKLCIFSCILQHSLIGLNLRRDKKDGDEMLFSITKLRLWSIRREKNKSKQVIYHNFSQASLNIVSQLFQTQLIRQINFQYCKSVLIYSQINLEMQPIRKRKLDRITSNFMADQGAMLGQGQFGKVYLGLKSDQNKDVAVKIFTQEKLASFGKLFQREVQILQALKPRNHPNLVHYYGHQVLDEKFYVFFELCKGNLMDKLMQKRLQEETIKHYFRDIMAGLVELHSNKIIHRDLKPQNILVCSQGRLKLTDFGLSRKIDPEQSMKLTMTVGTCAYRSPETFRNQPYDGRADVWSAGLILYRMLADCFCREFPLKTELDIQKRNQALQKGKLNLSFQGYSPIWEGLLRKMLICDPDKRATSKEILYQFQEWINRPLFNQFSQEKVISKSGEAKRPQTNKIQQNNLIQEVLSSLRDEETCSNLLEYIQYLNYYNEFKRHSIQNQQKLLQIARSNSQLNLKYPNFLLLCSCFLANSMILVKFSTILDEITLVNYTKIIQESGLNQFEKERYDLLRNTTLNKFKEFVSKYDKDFEKDTTKLLSYRQRQGMGKFQTMFKAIAQFVKDKRELAFINILNLFDELYKGIDFRPSLTNLTDSEMKMLFLLKTLRQISLRFSKGYHPINPQEKSILKKSLENLDLGIIKNNLSA